MAEVGGFSKKVNIDDLDSRFEDILSMYNNVHEDESYRPKVNALINSVKEDLLRQLEARGTRNIAAKWSYPKPSWAYIPWIAFLDQNNEESMANGVYSCILFRRDMEGFYLTLIQGVTQYKEFSKSERLKKLGQKKEYLRKKLNYLSTHGFSLDNSIDLKAPSGSAGEEYDKATVLYKYYPKGSLPSANDLVKDLQTIIDAYRTLISQEDLQLTVGNVQTAVDSKLAPQTSDSESNFIGYLDKHGFVFDPGLVVSYLLSLKVKPFVILTGPSGCGKTKLAQLFAQYIAERRGAETQDYIVTDVKVGKSANHDGWTFPRAEFFNYYPELAKYQGQYDIEVDGIKGQGNLELLTRIFYQKNEAIKNRLVELASIDPSRRVTLKIFTPTHETSNYEVVPVGANWTENRHIIGYYNVITKVYQRTKALDILLAAREMGRQNIPSFLILDEMNLSHVERYFADFLSAIESGESIPLHTGDADVDVPTDLVLSPNLMVVGTVNVDETTYMFSPKVLDRANTIEVLPGSVSDYLSGEIRAAEVPGNLHYLENVMEDALEIRSLTIDQIREHFVGVMFGEQSFWKIFSEEVTRFQQCLKESGVGFGFRVVNEVSRFLLAAWRFEGKPKEWANWRLYFDMQIKQKILPKVHGSERSLGGLLECMFQLCMAEKVTKPPRDYLYIEISENATYKASAIKLKEMDLMLYNQRYVSFTR